MNKKRSYVFYLLLLVGSLRAQVDSLNVYYYENAPLAYTEDGTLKGIEIDIIRKYIEWMKTEKGMVINVNFKQYKEFSSFYNSVKQGKANVVGLGSVTNSVEREKEVAFSPSYLRNIAILVSNGKAPTIKSNSKEEISGILGNTNAFVVKNSSHVNYMNKLQATYAPKMKITFTETQISVLDNIAKNVQSIGYVDIVAYWSYLKKNPKIFLKMQKLFNQPNEYLGFIMPTNSAHLPFIEEFFERGFGFTSTLMYHEILEKYLGYEIIESVEIK